MVPIIMLGITFALLLFSILPEIPPLLDIFLTLVVQIGAFISVRSFLHVSPIEKEAIDKLATLEAKKKDIGEKVYLEEFLLELGMIKQDQIAELLKRKGLIKIQKEEEDSTKKVIRVSWKKHLL